MAREWIAEKLLQHIHLEREVTLSALAQQIDRARDRTRDSLVSLIDRGLVYCEGETYRITTMGRLVAESGKSVRTGAAGSPRQVRVEPQNLRARAWKALRMENGKSTLGNILTLILDGEEKSPGTNLLKYFKALCQAGILERMERRAQGTSPTSNGFVSWRIVQDVGPKAPVWQQKKGQVFDPNSGICYPLMFNLQEKAHGSVQAES